MVVFRIVHILAAVIWVGSLFIVVVYIQPIAETLGPAGSPFMAELRRRRLVDVILVDALVAVAAGAVMYWHDWHTFASFRGWIGTAFGATLTAGALLAISVIFIASLVTRPTIVALGALGRQLAEAGGTPPPELTSRFAALQRRLKAAERASLALVLLAAMAMAMARYL